MSKLNKKELLDIVDILEDIYEDPQGGIGMAPNFQYPHKKVRIGIQQIKSLIKRFGTKEV